MDINRIPGAVWPVLYGAVYLGLQTFVSAQWPATPPAAVLGLMAALGVAQGLLKVLWPAPTLATSGDPAMPAGAAAMPRGVVDAEPVSVSAPGKVSRFLI